MVDMTCRLELTQSLTDYENLLRKLHLYNKKNEKKYNIKQILVKTGCYKEKRIDLA